MMRPWPCAMCLHGHQLGVGENPPNDAAMAVRHVLAQLADFIRARALQVVVEVDVLADVHLHARA